MDKISIIVPVYKVEPYLRKCLDSIVGQSYQNLEIVLVDDGSPDKCGAICDEYAARDERIIVIHKQNGGLSSARNAGLAQATGDWIGWVDSDDWVEMDVYEYLLKKAQKYRADVAICGHVEVCEEKKAVKAGNEERVLEREAAIELLLKDELVQSYVWDKLSRRELWQNVRFPEGRTYEDIAVTYRLFERAERVVYLPEAKYNYRQRQGSIVADVSLENRLNCYRAMEERYTEMIESWPQFQALLVAQQVSAASGVWTAYYRAEKSFRRQAESRLREVSAFCKPNIHTALNKLERGLAGQLIFHLTAYPRRWAYATAYVVSQLYTWKHGRRL